MIPLFSVIIPFYQREDLLLEALQSALNQSCKEYEIILINDGTPHISDKLQRCIADYPVIRYVEQPHSGFPGAVRNRGVAHATGEWLAFLDSDDLWVPHKLERCKAYINGAGSTAMSAGTDSTALHLHNLPKVYPLIHSREEWIRNGERVSQRKQKHAREGDIFFDALKKCIIGPSTTVMRRDIFLELGGFREDIEIAEDYELWLRYCDRYKVSYIEEPLVIKRAGPWEQLSTKYQEIEIFRIHALKELVDREIFTKDHQQEASQELARKCHIYGMGAEKRGDQHRADTYYSLANRYNPVTFS